MNAKLTGMLILVVLLVVVILQNAEPVTVRLLFWDVSMSRVILMLTTALVGFVCGFIVAKSAGRASKKDAA